MVAVTVVIIQVVVAIMSAALLLIVATVVLFVFALFVVPVLLCNGNSCSLSFGEHLGPLLQMQMTCSLSRGNTQEYGAHTNSLFLPAVSN